MRLVYSVNSPYARKVRIALLEKRISFEGIVDAPGTPGSVAGAHNPLGKVPVLLRDDGRPLYDSPVIAQYLEATWPDPRLIPTDPEARFETLRWEALSDGICDAAVTIVLELRRDPAHQDATVIERQRAKIAAALAQATTDLGAQTYAVGDRFGLADIALVAALGYVDLRVPELRRGRYPRLDTFMAKLHERESVRSTTPPG